MEGPIDKARLIQLVHKPGPEDTEKKKQKQQDKGDANYRIIIK